MKIKISNIGLIATWSIEQQKINYQSNVELLIENGIIREITQKITDAEEEIDVDGAFLTPGFIDSHTHPVFVGNRATEFSMRVAGKSYEEIAASGGGIISSIEGVRNASEDQLFEESLERLDSFLFHGTTTIEAKSGYGLDLESELKSLRVINRLNQELPLTIVPTFLGAHAFPPEYRDRKSDYVDLICNEMIPAVAEEKLAEFCDVFCERGYYSVSDSRKILLTAKEYGLIPRLHADEFIDSGAAELAGELGAISADHLMTVSEKGIQALAESGVIATLLPGTTLFLGTHQYAPGRKIIDQGVEVALATDFNPGSCTLTSLPLTISLATLYCGLTIDEAFKGVTFNAAKAINRHKSIGLIKEGYQADIVFWNVEELNEIPYWLGSDRILSVMKNGELIEM